jgi:SPP1 family phage portal protein
MELKKLQQLLAGDAQELYNAFQQEYKSQFDPIDFMNYDPRTHKVIIDKVHRPDKIVNKPIANQYDEHGNQLTYQVVVPVSRVAIPFQEEIVDVTASFTVGGKIDLVAKPLTPLQQKLYDAEQDVWDENKFQFKLKEIAKRQFSETEVAVLFFSDLNDDGKPRIRFRIISPSMGEQLHPIFDGKQDMIAFAFEYIDDEDNICFDVYTKDMLYKYRLNDVVQLQDRVPLNYGKIPVIYFSQMRSEWAYIQSIADRINTTISNLCDSNDYTGSPILFAEMENEGDITGFSDKGESGKVLKGVNGAKLNYLTFDKAPESVKLELETLTELIYNKTRTVNLSPTVLKGLGDVPSGASWDRMMISPHMKAQDKQDGSIGEGTQRIVNFIKSAIVNFLDPSLKDAKDLKIKAKFNLYRMNDISEKLQDMQYAMPGEQVMSLHTAIAYIGAVSDVDAEEAAINKEKADAEPTPTPAQ